MQDVSGFLKKFSFLLHKKEQTIECCISVIEEVAKISVQKEQLKIRRNTLVTIIPQAEKSQLFIKKKRIVSEINKRLGKTVITEIR